MVREADFIHAAPETRKASGHNAVEMPLMAPIAKAHEPECWRAQLIPQVRHEVVTAADEATEI